MTTAFGPGYSGYGAPYLPAQTGFGQGSAIVPLPPSCNALTGGFVRYAGDDWDGANLLVFQYGTLVKGAVTTNPDGTTAMAPDTVTPIDITGFQPVGSLILMPRPVRNPGWSGPSQVGALLPTALTVAAGTARIVDAPNGVFGFCPRSDITSRIPTLPDWAQMPDATLQIAAKLIDTATPGNLGTIAKAPILVYQA